MWYCLNDTKPEWFCINCYKWGYKRPVSPNTFYCRDCK